MVVVAIIGILAAIAIPNYQKFQARARQTEAKISLGGAYTSEKAFATEQSSFTSCLADIGIRAEGAKIYYTVGVTASGSANANCGPRQDSSCAAVLWDVTVTPTVPTACTSGAGFAVAQQNPILANSKTNAGTVPAVSANLPAAANAAAAVFSQSLFTIGAAGNISNVATYDQWTIDANKNLNNVTMGL
jgi:type IV pilus assembly protein PilA